ncbi:MAG: hypothetical protein UU47_C0027G0008 [candidate division TM6 bacterium GW2011_GWE2_41_16]|nr:MAG: hypothetical protein UU47_C0027G0008 [candidate division TM6 bacterium GW2011_GWE2_41_16]
MIKVACRFVVMICALTSVFSLSAMQIQRSCDLELQPLHRSITNDLSFAWNNNMVPALVVVLPPERGPLCVRLSRSNFCIRHQAIAGSLIGFGIAGGSMLIGLAVTYLRYHAFEQ